MNCRSFLHGFVGAAVLLLSPVVSQAVDRCVGPAATGNGSGSDWNNKMAWSATPARGDVWYLEDGDYPGKKLTVAANGTTRIVIKKAIATDHLTDTGWSATMGDGQAVFSDGIDITTSYWTLDGQTGGGPGNWKNGFGFRINAPDTAYAGIACPAFAGAKVYGLLIRHVEIHGPSRGGSDNGTPVAVQMRGCEDSLFEYIYANDMGSNMVFGFGKRIIFQYFWFGYFPSTTANHGETASIWGGDGPEDWTFRWGVITHAEGTGGLIFGNSGSNGGLEVYGCVFVPMDGNSLAGGNGLIGTWSAYALTRVKVYNNTFINVSGPLMGIFDANDSGEVRNNLFYNFTNFGAMTNFTSTHNHFASAGAGKGTEFTTSTGDPFVDWQGGNFAPKANLPAGTDLGSPYNIDMFGRTRTTWTRGAIEFATSGPVAAISVSPASQNFGSVVMGSNRDLTFTVRNTGTATLTGVASVAAPFSITAGASYNLEASQTQAVTVRYTPVTAGNQSQNVTFTGGGGATTTVSGVGLASNTPPIASAISQNAADVDPGTAGLQVYEGTSVQYSGTGTDPNGDPLTWQWVYSINGGTEIVHRTGSGTVLPATFNYGAGSAGKTYLWKLRVNDGQASAESQLAVGVRALPPVGDQLVLEAESGTISGPFVVANGAISQPDTTDLANGGRAVFNFSVTAAGDYVLQAFINAPALTANSFYINVDAEPQEPFMAWDILPPTTGQENRLVSWRGNGTADANEIVPKVFNLTPGNHQLIIRGRESNTQLDRITIIRLPLPPQRLRVVTPPQ